MKRTNKKLSNQKYIVLERTQTRADWTVSFGSDEFETVDAAMEAIKTTTAEDPLFWCDIEFKIAAINEQLITVKAKAICEVEVRKE